MGLRNSWDMVKDRKRKEQIVVALNNKSLIKRLQRESFKVCALLYDASPYFGECGKKLMWKGHIWAIICKIISGLGLFKRFDLILI